MLEHRVILLNSHGQSSNPQEAQREKNAILKKTPPSISPSDKGP